MTERDQGRDGSSGEGSAGRDGALSRRSVLGGASRVAAAGAALTAAGAVMVPELAGATGGGVAVSPKGTTCIEFVAQIDQHGDGLITYGYLTKVAGLDAKALFTGPDQTAGTARLTAYAAGQLVTRAVEGNGTVHSLDVVSAEGLFVYLLPNGGASFSSPDSFRSGTPVAGYDLTIQDILTVIAPNTGIPTLIGDLRQTAAGSLGRQRFGQVGSRLRLLATGLGTRTDASLPAANLTISGNLASV